MIKSSFKVQKPNWTINNVCMQINESIKWFQWDKTWKVSLLSFCNFSVYVEDWQLRWFRLVCITNCDWFVLRNDWIDTWLNNKSNSQLNECTVYSIQGSPYSNRKRKEIHVENNFLSAFLLNSIEIQIFNGISVFIALKSTLIQLCTLVANFQSDLH